MALWWLSTGISCESGPGVFPTLDVKHQIELMSWARHRGTGGPNSKSIHATVCCLEHGPVTGWIDASECPPLPLSHQHHHHQSIPPGNKSWQQTPMQKKWLSIISTVSCRQSSPDIHIGTDKSMASPPETSGANPIWVIIPRLITIWNQLQNLSPWSRPSRKISGLVRSILILTLVYCYMNNLSTSPWTDLISHHQIQTIILPLLPPPHAHVHAPCHSKLKGPRCVFIPMNPWPDESSATNTSGHLRSWARDARIVVVRVGLRIMPSWWSFWPSWMVNRVRVKDSWFFFPPPPPF